MKETRFHRAMPSFNRYKLIYPIMLALLAGTLPRPAAAVQWKPLTGTSRYNVAFDEESIRLTPLGRLTIWLRFVPKGETQRKAAAAVYGEKNYRSHLEYYEIDCNEQGAVLSLVNIFGPSRSRLKSLKGGTQPEAIIPGSVLDMAAKRVCPELDEVALEDEQEAPDPEADQAAVETSDKQPAAEALQKINELRNKAAEEPNDLEAWRSLGNAYFDADLPEPAIEAYNHALTLKPNDTDILNDQGAMYRQKGEFRKALSNFEKAFKIDPNNLESLYNSGYVNAFDLNDIPRALVLWRQYLTLDNNSDTARQVQSFIERYK